MGEVYRARDTKLERDVAVKVLPDDFADDPERLARFEREAKLLAQLNHPNIASIYGLEDDADTRFIAIELVAGESLAERVEQGPVALDEALAIARQIALALEAAHRGGVVHRDLKPANVMVTPDGTVKVLDFGLAKAYEADGSASMVSPDISASPTIMNATRTGMIIGTAAYMSPEQAAGGAADKRADIWAFGVVVYEMLAGGRLFQGESAAHVLADVLKTDADLGRLPRETPAEIRRLLRRCLSKKADTRLHDIADARIVIDEVAAGTDEDGIADLAADTAGPRGASAGRNRVAYATSALLAIALVITGVGWWQAQRAITETPPVRVFDIETGLENIWRVAISPDGETLALQGASGDVEQLFIRRMDSTGITPIPGTVRGYAPFFSPAGNWIGFNDGEGLKKTSLDGAMLDIIRPLPPRATDLHWDADDTILFPQPNASIQRVSASGGNPLDVVPAAAVAASSQSTEVRFLRTLPGGEILFQRSVGLDEPTGADADIVVYSPATGETHVIVEDATTPRFVPPRYLFYSRAGSVWVVEYEPGSDTAMGSPTLVRQGVLGTQFRSASYDVAADGTIVYMPGEYREATEVGALPHHVYMADQRGVRHTLPFDTTGASYVRWSPDGRRVAVLRSLGGSLGDQRVVSVYDAETGAEQRISSAGYGYFLAWSGDGEWVYFHRDGGEIYRARPDFPGAPGEVVGVVGEDARPLDVSPDGRVLFTESEGLDLALLPAGDGQAPQVVLEMDGYIFNARYSPDGKLVAYTADLGGAVGVFVMDVETGAAIPVSPGGGSSPLWSADGEELVYFAVELASTTIGGRRAPFPVSRSGNFNYAIVRSQITVADGRLSAAAPEPLFESLETANVRMAVFRANWDIHPDGRLLYVDRDPEFERTRRRSTVTVVLNWLDQYKAGQGR